MHKCESVQIKAQPLSEWVNARELPAYQSSPENKKNTLTTR